MVQRLSRSGKAIFAAALVGLYVMLIVGMAIAHHRPGHNPTPRACEVSQGAAPEKNPHCRVSPSPTPTPP
jgi:hypothetical protein